MSLRTRATFRSRTVLAIAVFVLAVPRCLLADNTWEYHCSSKNWTIEPKPLYDLERACWGGYGLVFTFAGDAASRPPEFATAQTEITVPQVSAYTLRFNCRHDYNGAKSSRFAVALLLDGHAVWKSDITTLNAASHTVDLTPYLKGRSRCVICLRGENTQRVTNFPLKLEWHSLELRCGDQTLYLFPRFHAGRFSEPPPELPMRTTPARGLEWTRGACVFKPWAHVQYELMHDVGNRPEALKAVFGFNVLNAQPPGAFNSRGHYGKLTDEEFEATLAAFRKAGYRIVIYSSIMHCGHAPPWQHGELAAAHPDWSQRDMNGRPRTRYGSEWLCPSGPALDYTLDYTRGLVGKYKADGVQLDNNQFHVSDAGLPTCYCVHCQKRFKSYVIQRFGSHTKDFFDCSEDQLEIPVRRGPLFNLWIHWRYRAWAEAVQRFRDELGCVVIPNTQFYAQDWVRATDLQFQHGDLIYSETKSSNSEEVSSKLLLGQAYAQGKPVWSHYGTFQEEDRSRTYLRSPREIAENIYPNFGYLANPWIVFHGFDPQVEENRSARDFVVKLLGFRKKHPDLFNDLKPYGSVATLFSTRSRNFGSQKLIPSHVKRLRAAGVALQGVHDLLLTRTDLDAYRVIVAENVDALDSRSVQALVEWMNGGGVLIATSDLAILDEIGRPRPRSLVADQLKLEKLESTKHGEGELVITRAERITDIVKQKTSEVFAINGLEQGRLVEVRPYRAPDRRVVLHIVNHGVDPIHRAWTISYDRALQGVSTHAAFYCPESETPVNIPLGRSGNVEMRDLETYGVVALF